MEKIVKFLIVVGLISRLSALDQTKDIEGKDCTIVEPIRNYTFNLTGLRSSMNLHISSSDQPEKFFFNVCGPPSVNCNNKKVAACVKTPSGKEMTFGFEDKLYWNDGSIRFSFEGEKCDDKHNYSMNVVLHCDYSDTKNDFLGAFHESGQCEANLFLRTPLACLPKPPHMNSKCFVKNSNGEVFDFSSLSNANHLSAGPNGTNFMIGICNPILYGHEAACEAGTSVCQHDPNGKDPISRFKNVGMMTQDFKIESDHISLTMTSKEPCQSNKAYSSRFIFECDPFAKASFPTYIRTENCEHFFRWATYLACPAKQSCKVTNSNTGLSYDFTSLAGIQYKAIMPNSSEETIYFSVCSKADEPCMGNTGSCVVKNSNQQSTQAGVFNEKLMFDGKNPYLEYDNGAVCKKPGNKFTTRIDFICADDEKDEKAVTVEDGCKVTIHFKTLLVCGNIKNCIAKTIDDEEIDLTPLIDFDGNYIATVDGKKLPNETAPVHYLLNVCRPLNSKYSLNCRGSAGACRTVLEGDGKHEKELNLGHPDYSLTTKKNGDTTDVIMKYFDGGSCPTDPTENVTTQIRFYCNETAGLGNPVLQSIDNCEYSFDFPTNILCNERIIEMEKDSCSLVNNRTSVMLDLKLFGNNGVYQVGKNEVNICADAKTKFYTIVYKESMVRIEYSLGNNSDKLDVEVQLKCGLSNQTVTKMEDRILVMHESSFICPLLKMVPKSSTLEVPSPAQSAHDDTHSSTSKGLALGYAFLIAVVLVAFLAFYLVIRNPERREILRNIVKFRSRSSRVQYSRVRLGEESSLLDNNIGGLSDSDDDNILL